MGMAAENLNASPDALPQGRAVVVGLGRTGLSCARYLTRQGVEFSVLDSRYRPPGLDELCRDLPEVEVHLGGFDPAVLGRADYLVVSPGVGLATPQIADCMERGIPAIGDIELFARVAEAPIAAITGSNGKSTVTTLLGEMAKAAGRAVAVGGNLGRPALDLLADDADLYVLELSSFQLETTESLAPAVATVLNLSADHLDRYPDMSSYAAAKARILAAAEIAVLNADDPWVVTMESPGRRIEYTLDEPAGDSHYGLRQLGGETWLARGERLLLPAGELRILGRHNLANALAALAMGGALELDESAMLAALRAFAGLPHRTQFVTEFEGVRWYNDSKGTNVGACIAAMSGLDDGSEARTVLIAGGDGKGADFSALEPVLRTQARALVLIGRDAPLIESAVQGATGIHHATDMADAVARCAELARPGDRVLLSPACASFDMFDNYEHRGRVFTEAVQALAGGGREQ